MISPVMNSAPGASASAEDNLYTYLMAGAPPESVALIAGGVQTSYGELTQRTEQIAATLHALGVSKGDRVGLVAENSVFWVACYLAILKLGAVATPLPLRLSSEQINAALALVGSSIVCMDSRRARTFGAALPAAYTLVVDQPPPSLTREVVLPGDDAPVPTCPVVARDDMAALMFTSGSTGQPNAVKVSHRNIAANTDSIIEYLELTSADRIMAILPFEYCFGASLLHTHLRVGGSLVLRNSFTYLEDLLNELDEQACTGIAGVPSSYQHLLRRSSFPNRQFPHLRYVQQAGGRLPDAFIREFLASQPNVKFYLMYGQTEATARLSYLPPERLADKLGSIGRGIPGVRLSVLDADGKPVKPGEVGEIVAEGENVTLGYWVDDPAKAPFRDGKLYTGDMARTDEEGFIFVADRVSDFIKPSGHRVSSREVEEVLAQITDILEAAVVGMPDSELGEAARAFVVLRRNSTLSAKDIVDYCKKRLPSYIVPREIVFMPELPKNESQKILKKALKQYQPPD